METKFSLNELVFFPQDKRVESGRIVKIHTEQTLTEQGTIDKKETYEVEPISFDLRNYLRYDGVALSKTEDEVRERIINGLVETPTIQRMDREMLQGYIKRLQQKLNAMP